ARPDVGGVDGARQQRFGGGWTGVERGRAELVGAQRLLEEALLHADDGTGVGEVREVPEMDGDRLGRRRRGAAARRVHLGGHALGGGGRRRSGGGGRGDGPGCGRGGGRLLGRGRRRRRGGGGDLVRAPAAARHGEQGEGERE